MTRSPEALTKPSSLVSRASNAADKILFNAWPHGDLREMCRRVLYYQSFRAFRQISWLNLVPDTLGC
jgi:hypothetical protein